jgi:hypothetical protein
MPMPTAPALLRPFRGGIFCARVVLETEGPEVLAGGLGLVVGVRFSVLSSTFSLLVMVVVELKLQVTGVRSGSFRMSKFGLLTPPPVF